MKNPLVDALRQAHGDNETAQKEALAPDDAVIAGPNLLDSLSLKPEIDDDPAGENTDELALAAGDDAASPTREDELPLDASEDGGEVALAETIVQTASDASGDSGPNAIVTISRLSPLACLFAMSISAGAYVTYQSLAVANLNDDLREISSRVAPIPAGSGVANEAGAGARSVFSFEERRPRIAAVSASERTNGSVRSVAAPALALRDSAQMPTTPRRSDRAIAIIREAYANYQAGDIVEAERLYRRALDTAPNHPSALGGLAGILGQTSRKRDALATYERLLAVEPGNAIAASAVLAARHGENDAEFESELKILLQRFPRAAHLHFAQGLHYAALERWPEARLSFAEAQALNPSKADYSFNLAICLEQLGQADLARSYYAAALEAHDAAAAFDKDIATQRLQTLAANLEPVL